MSPKRGEIYLTDFEPVKGSEQGKVRPALIVQNDLGNAFSPTTIVAPITSRISNRNYPHEVFLDAAECGLEKDGTILIAQIRCVDKARLLRKLGRVPEPRLAQVNHALKKNLALE